MKKYLLLTGVLLVVAFLRVYGADVASIIEAPQKNVGKKVEFTGMVYSICSKNESRIFVSPRDDRTKRIPVIISNGNGLAFRGKEVTVVGVVKKTAYVAPKPCGRCDGKDCGKNVSKNTSDSYYVQATSVKLK